jgi:hypothetical protein
MLNTGVHKHTSVQLGMTAYSTTSTPGGYNNVGLYNIPHLDAAAGNKLQHVAQLPPCKLTACMMSAADRPSLALLPQHGMAWHYQYRHACTDKPGRM